MNQSRRHLLKGIGGVIALPLLESLASGNVASSESSPTRLLIVGNPFGMHPDYFFPSDFGKTFKISDTLKPLNWIRDRLTIISNTDHNMVSGHGREVSFLSGVLPEEAIAFPEKNASIDQLCARHTGNQVRFPSIGASLDAGIRMSWTTNGISKEPITDPQELFDHLFRNLTDQQKKTRRQQLQRNKSLLDSVGDQFDSVLKSSGKRDRDRLGEFQTSIRELERSLSDRATWLDKPKPEFDISNHFVGEVTITKKYDAIFDMIAFAFQTDLTRVATVEFPSELNYTGLDGVNRSYHGCTHNGRGEDLVRELVSIEAFQISRLSRCLQKLDSIDNPQGNGSLLDSTIVLFGSGMGYGGTHSNRNLPILVAGGGFNHRGHVDASDKSGNNMPLCNLFVTLLQKFGINRDKFNTSTGTFQLS